MKTTIGLSDVRTILELDIDLPPATKKRLERYHSENKAMYDLYHAFSGSVHKVKLEGEFSNYKMREIIEEAHKRLLELYSDIQ